jgi:hypothetical protein
MNSLDLNLLNIEYNIDNRVETDPNNEFWYSSTYLPLSQQLLGFYHSFHSYLNSIYYLIIN